jgi:hypothetical protein
MKTFNFLLVILFFSFSFQSKAQFSLGIKGGYTKAWEGYGETSLPEDAEIHVSGFNLSAPAYYQFARHFRVGLEPGYVQRGAACFPGYFSLPFDTRFYLNYVEMPLMISANFPVYRNKLEVFGKAGYGASFLITAFREQTVVNGDEPPERIKWDLSESSNFYRLDHGFYGGLGIGFNQIFLEWDYYYGLIDVDKFNTTKNRSMDFSLGYAIRL